MLRDAIVIDAVGHAYNLDPSNFADATAAAVTDMLVGVSRLFLSGGYEVPEEVLRSDWPIEDCVNAVFRESATDILVFHPTPIFCFKDGLNAVDKAAEAVRRWPDRVLAYATIDPYAGAQALEELERQHALFSPIGIKFYPSSWREGTYRGWRMDDPTVAYPIYERARTLGIKMIAVHKSIPLGPVPIEPFRVDDIFTAAGVFPDLNFEIVHGGLAFNEETAWLVARFPNVFINFEGLSYLVAKRPGRFQAALAELCGVGGPRILKQCFWATGAIAAHPRPYLDAFEAFQWDEEALARQGLLFDMPPLTWEDKRGILSANYARAAGIDLEARMALIANDEFASPDPARVRPWSTTSRAEAVGG